MPPDTPDIGHLARLARIAMSSEERARAALDLANILGLIETMRAVDVRDVAPMAHALDLTQRLREDRVTEGDASAALLALAPAKAEGLYLVPKVIE